MLWLYAPARPFVRRDHDISPLVLRLLVRPLAEELMFNIGQALHDVGDKRLQCEK